MKKPASSPQTPSRRGFLKGSLKHGSRALGVIALLGSTGAALSGCGQKGPLYLPEDEQKKKKKQA